MSSLKHRHYWRFRYTDHRSPRCATDPCVFECIHHFDCRCGAKMVGGRIIEPVS